MVKNGGKSSSFQKNTSTGGKWAFSGQRGIGLRGETNAQAGKCGHKASLGLRQN